jgi:hypothetical protein
LQKSEFTLQRKLFVIFLGVLEGPFWHELFGKKTNNVHLQSNFTLLLSNFFSAKFFFCILEKGILAGKKFTLQKIWFTLQRRLFVNFFVVFLNYLFDMSFLGESFL